MADIIIMPKLGFNMSEGKLVCWYKKEGDPVTKGEPVFSIETDKTSIDIEATADGVFRKRFIEAGDSVEVTLPIAIIAGAEENIEEQIREVERALGRGQNQAADAEQPEYAEAPDHMEAAESATFTRQPEQADFMKITPRARRKAKELGLNLESVSITGTGYQGGISEKDILAYMHAHKVKITPVAQKLAEAEGISAEEVAGSGIRGKITKRDVLDTIATRTDIGEKNAGTAAELQEAYGTRESEQSGRYTPDGKEILEVLPYSGVRKIIGDRLTQSKFTAPHLYFTQKINLERLLDLRKEVNGSLQQKTSVTDYIARAVIIALQKYPEMNSSLIGDRIEKYKSVNLGIAVAAPGGLIVPVIKNAEKKTLAELSGEAGIYIEKARTGKLRPDEYSGGTFSISNLGMFGIENFTAIINPPEVGILAISATKDEPFVETGKDGEKRLSIKPMMNITLSVDHRVIDGLLAARFVTEVKRLLEQPIELMM